MMFWYGHGMGWWNTDYQHTQWEVPFGSVSPADVLATRFAWGEISESEYRDRLTVLREAGRG